MNITLNANQEAWLRARVASGDFASVEDAARHLIDDRISQLEGASDDLAWAKPYVDEARVAVARGRFVSLAEHKAHNAMLLASLKS